MKLRASFIALDSTGKSLGG